MRRSPAIIISCLAFVMVFAPQINADEISLQLRIKETIKKVTPAFVFIGGGSGVIISPDGYILTNHHVGGESEKRQVILTNGNTHSARRIGIDPRGDLMLLKMESRKPFPYVEMGDSDRLEVGQIAIALGNPFGLGRQSRQPAASVGIVSAFHRSDRYTDAVQTDVAINPGNSGGPLFDLDGKLIAINGRMNTRFENRVGTGTAYSIPINRAKRFIPRFIAAKDVDNGRVRPGELVGLTLSIGSPERPGARVQNIAADSPLRKSGLKTGDIIYAVDGFPIFSPTKLENRIGTYPSDTKVELSVWRDGQEITIGAVLVAVIRPFLGISPDQTSEKEGAVIGEIIKGQPADRAGLKTDDVIVEFNGARIRNWDELVVQIRKHKPSDHFVVKVLRDNKEVICSGKLGER